MKSFRPDIIHAHYGLSGLLANLQRSLPVVTTYHGSDINEPKVYPFSRLCMSLSAYNIFVMTTPKSRPLSPFGYFLDLFRPSDTFSTGRRKKKSGYLEKDKGKSILGDNKKSLIPCGVDIELFKPKDKIEARKVLGLDDEIKYILFAGAFDNKVKNAEPAIKAVSMFSDVTLLELKGYTRNEVVLLMNAVDMVLMTSFTEGSPQFIKEAMACNCPVVSVPAGDVPMVINQVEGCYLTTYEPEEIAAKIKLAFDFGKKTAGRERIIDLKLDLETVAERIEEVYRKVLSSEY